MDPLTGRPGRRPEPFGGDRGVSPALALVTVAAAAGLARSFADGSFWWPVLAVALGVHAIGAWCRRRGGSVVVAVALAVTAVGLLVTWVVAGHRSVYGFPGPGALRAVHHWAEVGWEQLRTERAPTAVTRGLLVWVMLGVGLVAAGAEVLARRARQAAAALCPSLVLFAVLAALGTDRWRTAVTLAYLAACGGYLAVVHRAETAAAATQPADRSRPPAGGALWAPTLSLGTVATVVGFAAAGLVPGGDGPLVDVRRFGRPGAGPVDQVTATRLDPLVDLRRRLRRTGDLELFRVEARQRLRWRVVGLERFDGERWSVNPLPRATALARRGRPGTVTQRVEVSALRSPYLPAAATPVAVDRPGVTLAAGGGLTDPAGGTREGMTYRVWSDLTPPPGALPPPARRRLVALPPDLPAPVVRLARRVTAGARGARARAEALEAFFLGGSFRYDLSIPPPTATGALLDFLRRRRGFCEHFAAAHAVMARAVGLPARVVVGFTAGRWDPTARVLVVRGRDAHAWTEVWIDGEGWVAFEPTPAGDAPGQADPALGAPATAAPARTATTVSTTTDPSPTRAPGEIPAPSPVAEPEPPRPGDDPGLGARIRPSALAAAGLATLALTSWSARRFARLVRRRRRRRAADPSAAARDAYLDALEHLGALGFSVDPAATPRELAAHLASRAPATGAALGGLADRYATVVYAGRTVGPADAADAWRNHTELRRAARRERRALRGQGVRRSRFTARLRRRRAATAPASVPPYPRRTA